MNQLSGLQNNVASVSESHIAVAPLCDFFGINYKWQTQAIKSDPILKNEWIRGKSPVLYGDDRSRVSLTRRGFVRWVQLLNPSIVREELRARLIEFQINVFDWVFGKLHHEKDIAPVYKRLHKLKKLYSRIGTEIQCAEREVKRYMDGRFLQGDLFTPLSAPAVE